MNPGVARLAIVVALVLAGVTVLANGFADEETGAAPPTSPTPSPTESPTPTRSPENRIVGRKENVLVQVFNGTNAAGLAADFMATLEADLYIPAGQPADAPEKPVLDSIVYFAADEARRQNRADAELLAQEYLDGAPVDPLPADFEGVDPAADVIVVLGEDMAPTT